MTELELKASFLQLLQIPNTRRLSSIPGVGVPPVSGTGDIAAVRTDAVVTADFSVAMRDTSASQSYGLGEAIMTQNLSKKEMIRKIFMTTIGHD